MDKMQVAKIFMAAMDTTIPMIANFKLCMDEALEYKWNSATIIEVMSQIESHYIQAEIEGAR